MSLPPLTVDFIICGKSADVQTTPAKPKSKPRRSTNYTLYPISPKAQRRGYSPRNVEVEVWGEDVGRPGQVFVRWVGWNYWCWVSLKGDPHYEVRRGWKGSDKVVAPPYHRTF